ncbi:hypothetical protein PAHAL_6G045100 [Panicum hallii]|jgi:hypothetical protein|uniref:Uncharacterized protein n=1 Tax=Panicum hallii TaxID=206008 RepID=A0A2S3I0H2_9POAL|nr:hypothetical protein PAHAL_6G045100 [Panicum hallii]
MERGTVACGGRLSTQWRFYLGQWRQVKIAGTRSGGHHHVPPAAKLFISSTPGLRVIRVRLVAFVTVDVG